MATKRNTKKKEVDTSTSDLVADLMGDRLVASHIQKWLSGNDLCRDWELILCLC